MFQTYYTSDRMDGAVKSKVIFDNIGLNAGWSELDTCERPVK